MYYNVTLKRIRVTILCRGYSECVSEALVIQQAKGMCHIIYSVVCPAVLSFSTLS